METNGVTWLPEKGALPQKFVTGLLAYLSPKEKGNLAEIHVEWAKRIIRGNKDLHVVHAKSLKAFEWVKGQLAKWKSIAEKLKPTTNEQAQRVEDFAYVRKLVLIQRLRKDNNVWLAIDSQDQLQALAVADQEEGADFHEVSELITAPWNLWQVTDCDDLPQRVRGAGTLLTTAIARHSNRPLELVTLDNAIPFYERCGFVPNSSIHLCLTPEKAQLRLGHLKVQQLDEKKLIDKLTQAKKIPGHDAPGSKSASG
jgi:hypothetical protein